MTRQLDVAATWCRGSSANHLALAILAAAIIGAASGHAQAESTPLMVVQASPGETQAQARAPERPQQIDGTAAAGDRDGLLADIRAAAEERGGIEIPTLALDVGFFSKYVWRGIVLTDDPVAQPAVTVDWYGFSLNVWGNMDLTGVNDNRGQFNEVDFTFSYTRAFGPLEATVGVVHYYFPNTPFRQTTEFFAGLGLPDLLLTPSITAYFDVDEADGWYLTGDVGHSFELPKLFERFDWSIDLAAGFGWASAKHNAAYFGVDRSGWTDFHSSISLPVRLTHYLTITPLVAFTSVLDSRLRGAVDDADNVIFGINVTLLF